MAYKILFYKHLQNKNKIPTNIASVIIVWQRADYKICLITFSHREREKCLQSADYEAAGPGLGARQCERMDWPGYLAIFGAFLLLTVWSLIVSCLLVKYRTRGMQGRCRPVTPPRPEKQGETSRDFSQVSQQVLITAGTDGADGC